MARERREFAHRVNGKTLTIFHGDVEVTFTIENGRVSKSRKCSHTRKSPWIPKPVFDDMLAFARAYAASTTRPIQNRQKNQSELPFRQTNRS